MKAKLIVAVITLSTLASASEIGLKLGPASIKHKDVKEQINLPAFLSIYLDADIPLGPTLSLGPSFELGSGNIHLKSVTCLGYGLCSIKFTYSTLEANAKAKLKLTFFQLFWGGGISLNRFGVDAFDAGNNKIATLREINAVGAQLFGGGLVTLGVFGIGAEVKVKKLTLEDVRYVVHYTVNVALTF